jgi:hypothetical protein
LPVRGERGEQRVRQVLASRVAVFGVRRPAVEVLDDAALTGRLSGSDRVKDRKSERMSKSVIPGSGFLSE